MAKAPRRQLSVHEHLSMGLLKQYGVPVPRGAAATTSEAAFQAAKELGIFN